MTGSERTWLPVVSDTAGEYVWHSENCLEEPCVSLPVEELGGVRPWLGGRVKGPAQKMSNWRHERRGTRAYEHSTELDVGLRQFHIIFVSVNAIALGRRARTRDAIGAVRHVFLDADHDGLAVLSRVEARRDLPSPSYVLHSSPNHIHQAAA
jgi:hypothetical protein